MTDEKKTFDCDFCGKPSQGYPIETGNLKIMVCSHCRALSLALAGELSALRLSALRILK